MVKEANDKRTLKSSPKPDKNSTNSHESGTNFNNRSDDHKANHYNKRKNSSIPHTDSKIKKKNIEKFKTSSTDVNVNKEEKLKEETILVPIKNQEPNPVVS